MNIRGKSHTRTVRIRRLPYTGLWRVFFVARPRNNGRPSFLQRRHKKGRQQAKADFRTQITMMITIFSEKRELAQNWHFAFSGYFF
jgi:hypothetical protein